MNSGLCTDSVQAVAECLGRVIFNPLLVLLFAAALLVFVWGLVKYLYAINIEGHSDGDGKKHMLWGIIGMFIMTAAFTIIKIISNTVGGRLPPGY